MENKLFEFVDKVYVINLIDREDRKKNMIHMFQEMGLTKYLMNGKIEFVEAVRLPGFTPEVLQSFGMAFFNFSTHTYNYGFAMCTFEHYRCLAKAQYYGYENILILEDDVRFLKNTEIINKAIDTLPSNYSILHLENFFWPSNPEEWDEKKQYMAKEPKDGQWLPFEMVPAFDNGCMIYSKKGINKIVERQWNNLKGCDHQTMDMIENCYFFNYPLAKQVADYSNIAGIYIPDERDGINVFLVNSKKEDFYE